MATNPRRYLLSEDELEVVEAAFEEALQEDIPEMRQLIREMRPDVRGVLTYTVNHLLSGLFRVQGAVPDVTTPLELMAARNGQLLADLEDKEKALWEKDKLIGMLVDALDVAFKRSKLGEPLETLEQAGVHYALAVAARDGYKPQEEQR